MSGDATDEAWQGLADANVEHDQAHEHRAVAELQRLGELVPHPRTPFDPQDLARAAHALMPPEHDRPPSRVRRLYAELRGRHIPTCLCGCCDRPPTG